MTSIKFTTIYIILITIISTLISHNLVNGTTLSAESVLNGLKVLNSLKETTTSELELNVTTEVPEMYEHVRFTTKDEKKLEWILLRVAALMAACLFICCIPWCQTNILKVIKEQKLRSTFGSDRTIAV